MRTLPPSQISFQPAWPIVSSTSSIWFFFLRFAHFNSRSSNFCRTSSWRNPLGCARQFCPRRSFCAGSAGSSSFSSLIATTRLTSDASCCGHGTSFYCSIRSNTATNTIATTTTTLLQRLLLRSSFMWIEMNHLNVNAACRWWKTAIVVQMKLQVDNNGQMQLESGETGSARCRCSLNWVKR